MREKYFSTQNRRISGYVQKLLRLAEDPDLNAALLQAKKRGTPPLHVSPPDGRHLEILARSVGAKNIVEIGTLCGYSAVCLAKALPENGKIYTCERSEHHTQVAREVFAQLGLDTKIQILYGDAMTSLQALTRHGPFDFVFIDADKENYPAYFDWSVENLRSGGLMVADNVFAFGYVAEHMQSFSVQGEAADSGLLERAKFPDTLQKCIDSMHIFNQKCATDTRLRTTFLPTGEGLMVAVKL